MLTLPIEKPRIAHGPIPSAPAARARQQRRLSHTHLRMLKVLAEAKEWMSLTILCRRAGIANVNVGRVYLSHIRAVLGNRVDIAVERGSNGRALYLLNHLDDGILPRCPHCHEVI